MDLPSTVKTPKKRYNRLIDEKSPYLLQHADNPVDWYPWGPEAFEKARKEKKPIFLSIGYSSCHWCHVMAHESFEDVEVAQLMNDVFVSVKVDREERVDIDNLYMTVTQMMTGSGGWPLTIILTPDKKPFFSTTYLPKRSRFGQIGMLELIPQIKELWETQRGKVLQSADKISATIQQAVQTSSGRDLDEGIVNRAYTQLMNRFDWQFGGFGTAPKFPTAHNLLFLLRYWNHTKDKKALGMVEKTLQAMRQGGIYDQVGFGFHRYATDAQWLVPHFEKMLYDQAMLALVYTEAYQVTGKEEYRKTVHEIFTYIFRDMMAPEGGFYSAEDADSEGEEGKFYLWTQNEIRKLLPSEEAELFLQVFNTTKEGNFQTQETAQQTGTNILHLKTSIKALTSVLHRSESELQTVLSTALQTLFVSRKKRIHPLKDDKILTDWNGLMIAALATAARVLNEPKYIQAAKRTVDFIWRELRTTTGRLLHRYREGQAAIPAFVDDHAFLIWGLIEIYQTTFEVQYLHMALEVNAELITHFWDEQTGGFFFTPDDGEELLIRQKKIYDGAIPSGNSVATVNLLRLGRIIANVEFDKKAAVIGQVFRLDVERTPSAHTFLLTSVYLSLGPSYEVIIAGNSQAKDTEAMLKAIWKAFIPNKVVILRPTEKTAPEIVKVAKFTQPMQSINGKATAYICLNYACKMPTTDIKKMLEVLHGQ
jgi:uncharacterized protein YyaL (SSP411 family)